MLGYVARHIVTSAKYDLSKATCVVSENFHTYDGWYIDPPYQNKCSSPEDYKHKIDFFHVSECDKVVVETTGPALGFALQEEEHYGKGDHERGSYRKVDAISHENLDASLFVKPVARPISELRHPSGVPKLKDKQPGGAPPK